MSEADSAAARADADVVATLRAHLVNSWTEGWDVEDIDALIAAASAAANARADAAEALVARLARALADTAIMGIPGVRVCKLCKSSWDLGAEGHNNGCVLADPAVAAALGREEATDGE